MTAEQSFFLAVLSDHLHRKPTMVPAVELDWNEIFRIAKLHQVEGIIYYQCKSFLPANVMPRFVSAYSSTVYCYSNRVKQMDGISVLLASYDYFVVKGMEVARFYPIPALRTMGDTDIIVRKRERHQIAELLEQNGFVFNEKEDEVEWHFGKNNIEYELHHALEYGSYATNRFVAFFQDCFEHCENHTLEPDYHLLYLLTHLRKHILNGGVGFRQFMDLAMYCNVVNDWNQVRNNLNTLGILSFAENVFGIINRWWLVESPLVKEVNDGFYKNATASIFENGVFGFDSKTFRENTFIKREMDRSLKRRLYQIFPPLNVLQERVGYEFLRKTVLFYPFAVLKHIFDYFNSKVIYRKQYKESIPDKAYRDRRIAYLESWGL